MLSAFFMFVLNPIASQLLPMALPADHFRSMHQASSDQHGLAATADATSLGMPKKN
jgi:multisubunit Na+/H+ antiporter MnhG subunit